MTDDFQLFGGSGEGAALDSDLALLTAYLARELSPVQVAAVEKRLVTDPEFATVAGPLLDAWGAAITMAPARTAAGVSQSELDRGWRRYVDEERYSARQRFVARARPSLRAAAIVAAVVVPLIGVAQGVARWSGSRSPVAAPSRPADPAEITRRATDIPVFDAPAGRTLGPAAPAIGSQPAPGAQPGAVPARLSDAEFWRLATSSSEPGGSFPSDNLTSNEGSYPSIIAQLRVSGDTGGAYLGVGPEQNFSYVAGLRPRIAFIVDIRRQSVIQHLMYKAIFEMAESRADFVSLLFARPRPAGLTTSSTIGEIWAAYVAVPRDSATYERNFARILGRLRDTHGFTLDSADVAMLRFVSEAFYALGPEISYDAGGRAVRTALGRQVLAPPTVTPAAAALAALPDSLRATLKGTIQDRQTGAALRDVTVRVAGTGLSSRTNAAGGYEIPGLALGSTVAIEATRLGFGTLRVEGVRIDQRIVSFDGTLGPNAIVLSPISSPAAISRADRPSWGSGAKPVTAVNYGGTNFASLTAALDGDGMARSFLATEDGYRYLRDIQMRNLFIPIVGNFAGPRAIRAVGDLLRRYDTPLRTFYVSNVEEYLFTDQIARAFYDNVATLPITPQSVFIRFGKATCPIGRFLEAVAAGRATTADDALKCVL